MAEVMEPCKFFNTPAGCRNGANCSFAHAFSMKPPCRFFGTEVGCRFGDSCMYSHDATNASFGGGAPRGRPFRSRGRGRGRPRGRGMAPFMGHQDQQWYQDESDEENAPPKSNGAKYKAESKLNDLLSFGLKPTPEGWEEYGRIQRALKEYDEDIDMEEGGEVVGETLNELLSFGLKPTPEGWDEYYAIKEEFAKHERESEGQTSSPAGIGRGNSDFLASRDSFRPDGPFNRRGRGGRRPRGRF